MTTEDDIKKIMKTLTSQGEEIKALRQKIAQLEETMNVSPTLASMIKKIQERKIVTIPEFRREGFAIYGGSRARLYEVLSSRPKFRIVPGMAKHAPTVIAYVGNEELHKDPALMAVDYLLQIPVAKQVITTSDTGKRYKKYVGQEGSLEGIMEVYGITKEKAYEVWKEIRRLFGSRIEEDKTGRKAFRRKY